MLSNGPRQCSRRLKTTLALPSKSTQINQTLAVLGGTVTKAA